MNRLEGKRCLLVGGTSGMGLATAEAFLREGCRLVVVGLPGPSVTQAAARLEPLGAVHLMACDVTDSAQVETMFAEAVPWLGGLDILYHLAGGSGRRFGDGALHECSDAGWDATLRLNLTSVFATNRAALRVFLQQQQGGVILNMASVLALAPAPTFFDTAAYTASKGAVIALSRQAAARYADYRIRVNVLAPGLIDTPMSQRAVQDERIQAFLAEKQPLRPGPGLPEDIVGASIFLCSDESRFLTGVVLPVDGGWSVR